MGAGVMQRAHLAGGWHLQTPRPPFSAPASLTSALVSERDTAPLAPQTCTHTAAECSLPVPHPTDAMERMRHSAAEMPEELRGIHT